MSVSAEKGVSTQDESQKKKKKEKRPSFGSHTWVAANFAVEIISFLQLYRDYVHYLMTLTVLEEIPARKRRKFIHHVTKFLLYDGKL